MSTTPDRRLRLVVPHRDGELVWSVDGDLPAIDVRTLDGEATAGVAARTVAALDLPPGLVDCAVDQSDQADLGDRLREALVVTSPPAHGWSPPDGRGWTPWSDLEPDLPPGIDALGRHLVGELSGALDTPVQRVPWCRAGWYPEAAAWIERTLRDHAWPTIESITPIRLWTASAIMRVDAAGRRCWFKASTGAFARESTISEVVDELGGPLTPSVIAIEADRGWMLLADLGPTEVSEPADTAAAIDGLAQLQPRLRAHRDRLVDAGCAQRPLDALPDELERGLRSAPARTLLGVDDDERARLVSLVAEAVSEVATWGLPESFVHGDFHPGNVAATADGPVIFDWSDACFSAPIVDAATWLWWYEDEPDHAARVWAWFCDAWTTHLGVDPDRLDRRTASIAASAFHAVSYLDIVVTIEPLRQVELADGLHQFVGALRRMVREQP